ncbi:MAG: macro domain-containing protein [Candidatus Omnitrophota bacterium]
MIIDKTKISIVQGDITEIATDAIVNAANNKLVMGGGVAGVIKKKGGIGIEEEAIKKGPIKIGEAIYTSAGALKAKYVIHAATMGMDFKTDEHKIRAASHSAFKVAGELNIKSIAFPALGCGTGGFPLKAGAKIMAQEVLRYLKEDSHKLEEVCFCLYDKEAYDIFRQNALGYLDYIVNKLKSPFVTVDAIIELERGIVIIERSNPPFGWALPGGFVDYKESLEQAVVREAKEETGLDLKEPRQFHTYSSPERDPRFHTIGTVFIAQAEGLPQAGDDAMGIKVISLDDIEKYEFAFDHKQILVDYREYKEKRSKK